MATLVEPRRILMDDVSWETYDRLLEDFGHGATRMVYDKGMLEIMTTSGEHENVKTSSARLLEYWATEMDWPISGLGNVTLRRRDLLAGLEPDECYYIETPMPPTDSGELDLNVYPPPDLAIEVEITRSSLDKVSVYARIGVREIWRWTGEHFIVVQRQEDGKYLERPASRFLPKLPMDVLSELTRLAIKSDQPTAMRALRDRLRSA